MHSLITYVASPSPLSLLLLLPPPPLPFHFPLFLTFSLPFSSKFNFILHPYFNFIFTCNIPSNKEEFVVALFFPNFWKIKQNRIDFLVEEKRNKNQIKIKFV